MVRGSERTLMDTIDAARFDEYARRKTESARAARLEPFTTVDDRSADLGLWHVENDFTDVLLDGPFFQSPVTPGPVPLVNLVFVQSREGNTEADDPSTLGAGETDKHVIYEGLSRVAADAVMMGARTAAAGDEVFSVWHPEMVALRTSFGKPRHPTQIVASLTGSLPIEQGLLFNVPQIPVVIVSAGRVAVDLAGRVRSRRWISVVTGGTKPDLRYAAEQLRRDFGIARISAIGGRTLATALIDADLVTDIYLTTSPMSGGVAETPVYSGKQRLDRHLVIRKRSASGVVFEHFIQR